MAAPPPPSTTALALSQVPPEGLRPLKGSLEDLDDEDLVAIGRVILLRGPARARKNLGVGLGVGLSLALLAVSPVGTGALLVGIGGYQLLSARRDIASDFEELGFSRALAVQLAAAVGVRSSFSRRLRWSRLWRGDDEDDWREIGAGLVTAAAAQAASTS